MNLYCWHCIPFNELSEWEEEPADPDDVWAAGDEVRIKRTGREGLVFGVRKQPLLGGYLWEIGVLSGDDELWLSPDELWRVSRFYPSSKFSLSYV